MDARVEEYELFCVASGRSCIVSGGDGVAGHHHFHTWTTVSAWTCTPSQLTHFQLEMPRGSKGWHDQTGLRMLLESSFTELRNVGAGLMYGPEL